MTVTLCDDDELDYRRRQTRLVAGQPLRLDENYRLAHLPLVAPDHPDVIPRAAGKPYERGRHPPVTSLVLPVPGHALYEALISTGLDGELRRSGLAHKVAWHVLARRRDRLHATLCGSLASGRPLTVIGAAERTTLSRMGGFTVELRGLFSGNVNLGRLYVRLYPEKRCGLNVLHCVQDAVGGPRTGLYVVGLYNLLDGLQGDEAAALTNLIERWWERPLLRFRVDALWLLSARDDLVLDGEVLETIPLC